MQRVKRGCGDCAGRGGSGLVLQPHHPKAGIKTVIIPAANKPDLEEVDDEVKSAINFIFAENLTDVLDNALVREKK